MLTQMAGGFEVLAAGMACRGREAHLFDQARISDLVLNRAGCAISRLPVTISAR
jgi:hypothetical protein